MRWPKVQSRDCQPWESDVESRRLDDAELICAANWREQDTIGVGCYLMYLLEAQICYMDLVESSLIAFAAGGLLKRSAAVPVVCQRCCTL